MKKRKKKEKEKKEKGEKKKGKEARRAAGAVSDAAEPFSSRRCSLVVALAILRPHPPPSPFFFFSLLLSSLSPLLPLNLYHLLLSRFLILIFPKRFRALRRGWLPIRLLPLPLLLFDLLSHPRSPFILDHWISLQHPAQTERTNGFLSLFPRFSGAEENVTDFESRVLQLSASSASFSPPVRIYMYISLDPRLAARDPRHILLLLLHCSPPVSFAAWNSN